jgi:hypothetical protein
MWGICGTRFSNPATQSESHREKSHNGPHTAESHSPHPNRSTACSTRPVRSAYGWLTLIELSCATHDRPRIRCGPALQMQATGRILTVPGNAGPDASSCGKPSGRERLPCPGRSIIVGKRRVPRGKISSDASAPGGMVGRFSDL